MRKNKSHFPISRLAAGLGVHFSGVVLAYHVWGPEFRSQTWRNKRNIHNFTTYYKVTVMKMWYCHKDRHIDQKNRIESSDRNSEYMAKWFSVHMTRPFNGGEDKLLNKWCWKNWISTCKRTKLDPYLAPYAKKQLKMDHRPKCKNWTFKTLEENMAAEHVALWYSACLEKEGRWS
jgi:hypothetical protein